MAMLLPGVWLADLTVPAVFVEVQVCWRCTTPTYRCHGGCNKDMVWLLCVWLQPVTCNFSCVCSNDAAIVHYFQICAAGWPGQQVD